jgi:hypothetical protein
MGLLSFGRTALEAMAVDREIKDGDLAGAHARLLADLNDRHSPREHYDLAKAVQVLAGGNEIIINRLGPGHVAVSMMAPEVVRGPYGDQVVNAQLPLADIYGINCVEAIPACGYAPNYCGPLPFVGNGCFVPAPYYGRRGYVSAPVVQNVYETQVRNSTFAVPEVHAALQTIPHQHPVAQMQQFTPRASQQFTPRASQPHFAAPQHFNNAAPAPHAEFRAQHHR